MKLHSPNVYSQIFYMLSSLIISCHSENNDPKLDELNQEAALREDSLVQIINNLRTDIRELKDDTTEAHALLKDYQDLKIAYQKFGDKVTNLNIKDHSFAEDLEKLKQENEELSNKFKNLNSENSRFKILASEVKDLKNKNASLGDENLNLLSENEKLKKKSKSEADRVREKLTIEIDSLEKVLNKTISDLGTANSNITNANATIAKIEEDLARKKADLDNLPDVEASFNLEYLPHNTKGLLKQKYIKMVGSSTIEKKNLGSVRVIINTNKLKSDAKEFTIYIEYLIVYKKKNDPNNHEERLNPKSIMIQGKSITYSDSIVVTPQVTASKVFEIYSRKLPNAEHHIKFYYKSSDISKPPTLSFKTN